MAFYSPFFKFSLSVSLKKFVKIAFGGVQLIETSAEMAT